MKVVFLRDTEADVIEAVKYYEQFQSGLGQRILKEIQKLSIGIQQFPESYLLVSRRLRRANLSVIPYQLYFAMSTTSIPLLGLLPSRMYPPNKAKLMNRRFKEWEAKHEDVTRPS